MQENQNVLQAGTLLDSGVTKYKIVSVLGQGGFGITYLVTGELKVGNVTTEAKFAIKEHFPDVFATRNGATIEPKPDKLEEYDSSLADFKSEARKLQKMGDDNDNIVKVNEIFEANGTAYYVMQYINGTSLTKYVASKKKLSFEEAVALLAPVFDAVDYLHRSKINHLDIKPDNVMLHDGLHGVVPVLIDFGLSIHFKKNGDKTSPKGVQGISEGYSPMEQYVGIQEFRPETDIYALAATLLYAVTGVTPKSAAELKVSDLRPVLSRIMPEQAVEGMCKALAKSSDDRTSSISVFKSDLGITSGSDDNRTRVITTARTTSAKGSGKLPVWLLTAIGGVALVVGCVFLFKSSGDKKAPAEPAKEPVAVVDSTEVQQQAAKAEAKEVPDTTPQPAKTDPATAENKENVTSTTAKKENQAESPAYQEPATTYGSLSLGYGRWTGSIVNGKASGKGRVTFTSNYRFPGTSVDIEPGDYLDGTYENGKLVVGRVYDSEGNSKGTVMP